MRHHLHGVACGVCVCRGFEGEQECVLCECQYTSERRHAFTLVWLTGTLLWRDVCTCGVMQVLDMSVRRGWVSALLAMLFVCCCCEIEAHGRLKCCPFMLLFVQECSLLQSNAEFK